MDEGKTARVTVSRNLPIDVRDRQIMMKLDGTPIATLMFGETVTRDIEPGYHWIRANNTLIWKTLEFRVKPGDHVEFVVANRSGFGTFTMLGLLGVGPLYLVFRRS